MKSGETRREVQTVPRDLLKTLEHKGVQIRAGKESSSSWVYFYRKKARALHRDKQILRRFNKSYVLTLLFFTIIDAGHG
jgi:hypothetical protein